MLSYKLDIFPPALFEITDVMLSPYKASLADHIEGLESELTHVDIHNDGIDINYVTDGCAQLYRLQWKRGWTYQDICCAYLKMFPCKLPRKTTVFFYGYKSSTNDGTHERRDKQCQDVEVMATSMTSSLISTTRASSSCFCVNISQHSTQSTR